MSDNSRRIVSADIDDVPSIDAQVQNEPNVDEQVGQVFGTIRNVGNVEMNVLHPESRSPHTSGRSQRTVGQRGNLFENQGSMTFFVGRRPTEGEAPPTSAKRKSESNTETPLESNTKRRTVFAQTPQCRESSQMSTEVITTNSLTAEGPENSRGMALIISLIKYKRDADVRDGVEKDMSSLKATFQLFGMRIFYPKNQMAIITKTEISRWLEEYKSHFQKDHHKSSIVVITGHGKANDFLIDSDNREMNIQTEIINLFDNHNFPAMLHMPKIFVMQCCRGNQVLRSVRTESREVTCPDILSTDSDKSSRFLAGVSETLVIWSTITGAKSFRDPTKGTYFIQELCCVLNDYADSLKRERSEEFAEKILRPLKGYFRNFTVPFDPDDDGKEVQCSQAIEIVDVLFGKFYLELNGDSGYIPDKSYRSKP